MRAVDIKAHIVSGMRDGDGWSQTLKHLCLLRSFPPYPPYPRPICPHCCAGKGGSLAHKHGLDFQDKVEIVRVEGTVLRSVRS